MGDEIEVVGNDGGEHHRRHPAPAHHAGRHDAIRPRLSELGLRTLGRGSGHYEDVWAQGASRKCHEGVVGIGVQGGQQPPRPVHSELPKHSLIGCVALNRQPAVLPGRLHRILGLIDDDEAGTVVREHTCDNRPHPAHAGNYVVVTE